MKAKISITCGGCGWALCRVNDQARDPLTPIACVNEKCTEYGRKYEPPTVQLIPVHAK